MAPKPEELPTYRLTIEYDGSRFAGWQVQKNARTVAGEVLRALADAGIEAVELGGAGRTDAGVHALAQVAHLRLARSMDPERLRRAVNDRLPAAVHLLAVEPAPSRFHARHLAVARSYVYQISRRRSAFAKPWAWWVREPLDVGRLRAAAALLVGRHDFRLFAVREDVPKSTLVEVASVEVAEDGDLVVLRFVASHYLWRMVRRLVGSLVRVATGDLDAEAFAGLLEGRHPGDEGDPARWTAPASGLFLERVVYPGDPPLPPLAAVTPIVRPPAPSAPPPAGKPPRRRGAR
jgi:tRNA pseudouridine38-40 synthase